MQLRFTEYTAKTRICGKSGGQLLVQMLKATPPTAYTTSRECPTPPPFTTRICAGMRSLMTDASSSFSRCGNGRRVSVYITDSG